MKKLLLLTVLVLAVFNALAYCQYGRIPLRDWGVQLSRDGWMASLKKLSPEHWLPQLKTMVSDITGARAEPVLIYQWTDTRGVVHYENRPVAGAKVIAVDPHVNVVPMLPPDPGAAKEPKVDTAKETEKNMQKIRDGIEARAGL